MDKTAHCFQHLVDVKKLLGDRFPWYDPARPERPGLFVAGSFATPSWKYEVIKVCVYSFDDNDKGTQEVMDFHMPKGRGDVDLFMAGNGDSADLAAEGLVNRLLNSTELNPFVRMYDSNACATCQCHTRSFRMSEAGECPKCSRAAPALLEVALSSERLR